MLELVFSTLIGTGRARGEPSRGCEIVIEMFPMLNVSFPLYTNRYKKR